MHYFEYKNNNLVCEGVPISKIAKSVGTPFYVYSHRTLERHYNAFYEPLKNIKHLICYAVKANSNIAYLSALAKLGTGMDIVSGGELFRALTAKVHPSKIVYSGVGKTDEEIIYALGSNILAFNVESHQELDRIQLLAKKLKTKARISIRVNPDIDAQTHPYISTGLKRNKFGIGIDHAMEEYHYAKKLKNLDIVGVDCHIGSQLLNLDPLRDTIGRLVKLILELKKENITISHLDMGGGLGINYNAETPPHPKDYLDVILNEIKDLNLTLVLEPGRVIAGNTGILVTKVLFTKAGGDKNFVIVDAAMNDLVRPSLYEAYHSIEPVVKKTRDKWTADIVGPVCESGDFLGLDRETFKFSRDELLAIYSAGAYGFSMASNYNSRCKVPEILVKDNKFFVIRERETYKDLIRHESIPKIFK